MTDGHRRIAVSADGVRIAFEARGTGPTLLLLHGFSDARQSWTSAGHAEALAAAGWRVVLVDARGHGESDRPTEAAAYAGRRTLADLTAVLDALAAPRAAVMGFSMGGVSALAAAAFLPQRVIAAVALGAHPFAEDLSWLRAPLVGGVAGWVDAVEAAAGGLDAATRRRLEANDAAALRAAVAADRTDFSARLIASGRPALAVLGDRDPRHAAAGALRRSGAVEVLTLAGADHFGTFLAARHALPEITAFLDRAARAPAVRSHETDGEA